MVVQQIWDSLNNIKTIQVPTFYTDFWLRKSLKGVKIMTEVKIIDKNVDKGETPVYNFWIFLKPDNI